MSRLNTVSKVLKIKNYRKEELETEVRKVHELIRVEKELLAAIEKVFAETVEKYEKRQQVSAVAAHEFELFTNYFSQLYDNMEQQKRLLMQRIGELKEIQQALVEAHRDEKLLEKLQEKIVKEQVKEQDRLAQKESDYLFLSRRHGKDEK
ncbi:MAG: flagellar FliJ family protein [Thermodesulfovibrionales bacterium]